MKITPLEIRQKEFEKKLRGYDKDEVTAFLLSLSNEWERVLDENKELSIKLRQSEKEVEKLREVENSLFKTLKTAEDTGANLISQANKAADLHIKETQMSAEGLMSEAKSKAKAIMEKAELEARQIIEELQDAVKSIEKDYRELENHRENALGELKRLSVDLIEKVERTNKEQTDVKFEDYVKRVKDLSRESEERIKAEDTQLTIPDTPVLKLSEKEAPQPEAKRQAEEKPPVAKEEKPELKVNTTVAREPEKTPEEEPKEAPQPEANRQVEEEPHVAKEEVSEPEAVNAAPQEVKETQEEEPKEIPQPEANQAAVGEPSVAKEEAKPEVSPATTQESEETPEGESKEDPDQEEKKGPRIARTVSFFDELEEES